MKTETPCSFESATIALTAAQVVPPIYRITVKGEAEDFGGVSLLRQPDLSDGYVIYDVMCRITAAIGSAPYMVTASLQQVPSSRGVMVRGANGEAKSLPWPLGTVHAPDAAHQSAVAGLSSLAVLESARLIGSSILLNPSWLEVTAQASGFNYKLSLVVSDEDPSQVDYLPYRVVQTQTGPGWPPNAGTGPVVLPQHLGKPIYQTGRKGIAVVGSNRTLRFDVRAPNLGGHQTSP